MGCKYPTLWIIGGLGLGYLILKTVKAPAPLPQGHLRLAGTSYTTSDPLWWLKPMSEIFKATPFVGQTLNLDTLAWRWWRGK